MTDYKDRVSGWVSDIDWSKAPEGFPIWIEDLNPGKGFDCSGWHRDDGDRYTNENGKYWTKLKEGIYRVHSPAPQWNGEGLPPVGTRLECQYAVEGFTTWHAGECIAVGTSPEGEVICVIKAGETIACYRSGSRMRPIKTPAQIAAEEREAAIDEMAGWAGLTGLPIDRERKILGRLYDGNYRRMTKGDDK